MKKAINILVAFSIMVSVLCTPAFAESSDIKKGNIDQLLSSTQKVDRNKVNELLKQIDAQQADGKIISAPYATFASSPYGSAWAYVASSLDTFNCYGYASCFKTYLNPGDITFYYGSPIGTGARPSVSTVGSYVQTDLGRAYRPARVIASATAAINANEYRIALRTGSYKGNLTIKGQTSYYDIWDYHFLLQCSNGGWCDKPGGTPTRYLGKITPSSYSWDLRDYIPNTGARPLLKANFYNSSTIYFAVKK